MVLSWHDREPHTQKQLDPALNHIRHMPIIQLRANILMLCARDTLPLTLLISSAIENRASARLVGSLLWAARFMPVACKWHFTQNIYYTLERYVYLIYTQTFIQRTSADDLQFWHIYWIPHKTQPAVWRAPLNHQRAPNIIIIFGARFKGEVGGMRSPPFGSPRSVYVWVKSAFSVTRRGRLPGPNNKSGWIRWRGVRAWRVVRVFGGGYIWSLTAQ